ncbi:unnamed protein product, partial [Rotaria sordida]
SIPNDAFNSLQICITNPSSTQQTCRILSFISSINFSDYNEQCTSQLPLPVGQYQNSLKVLLSVTLSVRSNRTIINTTSPSLQHNENILNAISITTVQPSLTRYI